MLHYEGEAEKERDYTFTVGELVDIILALNSCDPNEYVHTTVSVNQERMALFLKSIEFWRRCIGQERDIGVNLDEQNGYGVIMVYLEETEFKGPEIARFIRSLDLATDISIIPQDEEEVLLQITVADLFEPKESD